MAQSDGTQVAVAGRIKPGDRVVVDGEARTVAVVKRAAGRKPAQGENLHIVTEQGDVVRVNSTVGLRVPRRETAR